MVCGVALVLQKQQRAVGLKSRIAGMSVAASSNIPISPE